MGKLYGTRSFDVKTYQDFPSLKLENFTTERFYMYVTLFTGKKNYYLSFGLVGITYFSHIFA